MFGVLFLCDSAVCKTPTAVCIRTSSPLSGSIIHVSVFVCILVGAGITPPGSCYSAERFIAQRGNVSYRHRCRRLQLFIWVRGRQEGGGGGGGGVGGRETGRGSSRNARKHTESWLQYEISYRPPYKNQDDEDEEFPSKNLSWII